MIAAKKRAPKLKATNPVRNRLVGGKIRKLREIRGMKQDGLSLEIGCSQPVISDIENGKQSPWEHLPKIAKVLEINIAALVDDEDYTPEELAVLSAAYRLVKARHRDGEDSPQYQALKLIVQSVSQKIPVKK